MHDRSEPQASIPIFTASSPKRHAITALPNRAKTQQTQQRDAFVPRLDDANEVTEEAPIASIWATANRRDDTSTDDRALLAILDAPLMPGETALVGFARKERELRDAFAQLAVLVARRLHKRLANPTAGDMLAERFSRLTVERRNRLLQFLADARRRAAIAGGK